MHHNLLTQDGAFIVNISFSVTVPSLTYNVSSLRVKMYAYLRLQLYVGQFTRILTIGERYHFPKL